MTDIGTGSYTVIAQTVPRCRACRSVVCRAAWRFHIAGVLRIGRPGGGNRATACIYAACTTLREAIARQNGFDPAAMAFADGELRTGERRTTLAHAAGAQGIAAEDTIEFGELDKSQESTIAGHFIEVGVDAVGTAEVRVRRMLAVCASGRILNPGDGAQPGDRRDDDGGGAALIDELAIDERRGFFVNHDFAGYDVPVHADIPQQEVVFLDETDPISSPMKAKGVGELGLCGVAAAIANDIRLQRPGVRLRNYPLTLGKLLAQMPEAA